MKNFREVKTNSKKEHVMQKKIIFKDFLYRREKRKMRLCLTLFLCFLKFLYLFLLFLKTIENNFYLFFKNYYLFHFIVKN